MSKYPDRTNQPRGTFGRTCDVGYCRPPEDRQFKPGQSGNPRGRPKGSKNIKSSHGSPDWLSEIVLQEAHRTISIDDVDGPVEISTAQAVVRALALNAQKGSYRAQKTYLDFINSFGRESKRVQGELLQVAIDYKLEWQRVLKQRRRDRSVQPDPIPHPDQIIIDFRTGSVRIAGPMTEDEKCTSDRLKARKRESLETIGGLNQLIQDCPDGPGNSIIVEETFREKRIHELISTVIPSSSRTGFAVDDGCDFARVAAKSLTIPCT